MEQSDRGRPRSPTSARFGIVIRLFCLLVLVSVARPAAAQADWTIAGYLGAAHTATSAVSIRQPTIDTNLVLDSVKFRGRSFESPPYYGYRVGYDLPFARALSVEAEFIHAKVYARAEQDVLVRGRRNGLAVGSREAMSRSVEELSMSHGLNLILFNVVGRLPVPSSSSRFQLSGRLGAGPTVPHVESTIGGGRREQYELASLAVQAAAGLEVRMTHGLSLLGEYKFSRTDETVGVSEGQARVLVRTHHAVFGAGYRF